MCERMCASIAVCVSGSYEASVSIGSSRICVHVCNNMCVRMVGSHMNRFFLVLLLSLFYFFFYLSYSFWSMWSFMSALHINVARYLYYIWIWQQLYGTTSLKKPFYYSSWNITKCDKLDKFCLLLRIIRFGDQPNS